MVISVQYGCGCLLEYCLLKKCVASQRLQKDSVRMKYTLRHGRLWRSLISTTQDGIQKGLTPDEELMAAHMMFMTLIRDGTAIVCADENDEGFTSLYSY